MARSVEPDEQLMAQVARGRRESLGLLLRRHASGLLTFIRRMGADRHQSEELFQEVFLAVWTERARYEFPRPFRAWLLGIAVNKCRDAFRRAVPPAVAFDAAAPLAPAGGPGPADLVIAAETAVLVQRAVGQLPEQQRMVVVLRLWNGLSYSEIAEVTGRTESTVRSNMFHGLTAIRRYLEPRMR